MSIDPKRQMSLIPDQDEGILEVQPGDIEPTPIDQIANMEGLRNLKREVIILSYHEIMMPMSKRIRVDEGDLTYLKDSIERFGQQQPIVLDVSGEIIAGMRRFKAISLIPHMRDNIMCLRYTEELSHDEREMIEYAENSGRKGFTIEERVRYALRHYEKFYVRPGKTSTGLCKLAGMSQATFERACRVLKEYDKDPSRWQRIIDKMNTDGLVNPAFTSITRELKNEAREQRDLSETPTAIDPMREQSLFDYTKTPEEIEREIEEIEIPPP